MPKINLKNTNRDPLVSFIKRRKLSFSVKDRAVENGQRKEKILIRTNNQEDRYLERYDALMCLHQ